VPCLALVGLVAVLLNSSNGAYRQAQADSALVRAAVAIAKVDQALGNEAVVSSKFLRSLNGDHSFGPNGGVDHTALRGAWTTSSSAIDTARHFVGRRGKADGEVDRTLRSLQRSLSYRRDITDQTISPLQIADRYARFRTELLEAIASEAGSEVSAGSNNSILALLALIRARSAHVDERLILQLAVEYDQWAPGQHSAIIDSIVSQRERLAEASRLQGAQRSFAPDPPLHEIRAGVFLEAEVPDVGPDAWLQTSDDRLAQLDGWVEEESGRILQSMAAVEDQRFKNLGLTIFAVVVTLAIATFVALNTAYRLIRRVERITKVAEAVARDEEHVREVIGDHTNDEIGILARAFDEMGARIDRTRRQKELESGVLEAIAQRAPIAETFDASARLLGETDDGQSIYRLDVVGDDEIVVTNQRVGRSDRSPSDDELRMAVGFARMALQRSQDDERLEIHATRDDLTGLLNRRAIMVRVDELAMRATDDCSGNHAAVVFVDLDDFKDVNDRYGHRVGDRALITQAARLGQIASADGGVAGRLGGDEFLLAYPHVDDEAELQRRVDLIVAEIGKPVEVDDLRLMIGLSAGAACIRTGVSTADLLNEADTALYQAKAAGRGVAIVSTEELRAQTVARSEYEAAFRQALNDHEFQPWFQPIWSASGDELSGLEALARWQRPNGEMVGPGEFLALAEDLNLMGAFDRVLFRTTCDQVVAWHEAGIAAPRVNINVSPTRLEDPMFVSETFAAMRESGCRPEYIAVEVTETALMSNVEVTAGRLQELRTAGIAIAVDDFGQGYSSLAYLRELPVDVLKIDREFVSFIDASATNLAIVAAITQLADALGLSVVAEGVERPEELDALQSLGCSYAQGYLLGRPAPAAEIGPLLVANGCGSRRPAEGEEWFAHCPDDPAALGDRPVPDGTAELGTAEMGTAELGTAEMGTAGLAVGSGEVVAE